MSPALSSVAQRDRVLLLELRLDDLLLLFRLLLVGAEYQFGVGGQRLQKNSACGGDLHVGHEQTSSVRTPS